MSLSPPAPPPKGIERPGPRPVVPMYRNRGQRTRAGNPPGARFRLPGRSRAGARRMQAKRPGVSVAADPHRVGWGRSPTTIRTKNGGTSLRSSHPTGSGFPQQKLRRQKGSGPLRQCPAQNPSSRLGSSLMIVGVPKEIKPDEYRVGLLPVGVEELTRAGHHVLVEAGAGLGSGLADDEYVRHRGRAGRRAAGSLRPGRHDHQGQRAAARRGGDAAAGTDRLHLFSPGRRPHS